MDLSYYSVGVFYKQVNRMHKLRTCAILSLVFITFQGCSIATYRPTSDDLPRSMESSRMKKSSPLNFFFYTGVSKLPQHASDLSGLLPIEFEVLRRVFETVSTPVLTETPPDNGPYVVAYKIRKSASPASQIFCWISAMTLTAIPCYSGSSGYILIYNLYQDKVQRKTYRYEVIEKSFVWIGVAPFSWINALKTTYEQAIEVTTHQFLQDAIRDGYL